MTPLEILFKESQKNRESAVTFLRSRGISLETINRFEVGYLSKIDLSSAITSIPKDQIPSKLKSIETWNSRIILPIRSPLGDIFQLVTRETTEKKYEEVQDQTKSYFPSYYGLTKSLQRIWDTRICFLTEGAIDLMAVSQIFPNIPIIAANSQALTAQHKDFLSRYVSRLVLLFDRGTDKTYTEMIKALPDVDLIERLEWNLPDRANSKLKDVADLLKVKGASFLRRFLLDQFPWIEEVDNVDRT